MRSGNPQPFDCSDNLVPHQYKPGQSGNPGGKTSEQAMAERENARKATEVRGQILDRLIRDMAKKENQDRIYADPSILKLLKDSEDRGLGTPVNSLNIESPDGTMSPIPMDSLSTPALMEIAAVLDAMNNDAADDS